MGYPYRTACQDRQDTQPFNLQNQTKKLFYSFIQTFFSGKQWRYATSCMSASAMVLLWRNAIYKFLIHYTKYSIAIRKIRAVMVGVPENSWYTFWTKPKVVLFANDYGEPKFNFNFVQTRKYNSRDRWNWHTCIIVYSYISDNGNAQVLKISNYITAFSFTLKNIAEWNNYYYWLWHGSGWLQKVYMSSTTGKCILELWNAFLPLLVSC